MELRYIDRSQISEDPAQPRKQMNDEALQGLADSIRQHGLLNPITVRPLAEERYRVVTGERRWRAAGAAGMSRLPCIVKDVPEDELLTEQLIENLQREDLSPIDKARAIELVKRSLNLNTREVAGRLGLHDRTVSYLLDLLALPDEIGQAIVSNPNRPADGRMTEKHARYLKQLNEAPELQAAVVDRIKSDHLNSEDTGNLVRALKRRPDDAKAILDSPTDHLAQFFQDSYDPTADFLNDTGSSSRLSPHAQRILDFLPSLAGIDPAAIPLPEVRQVQDALTSLNLAVEGLLRSCRERLGE